MTTTHLNKLLQRTKPGSQAEDVKHFIYTRSKWLENEIDFLFLLASNNKCYKTRLPNDELKAIAADFDRNYKEFYDECKAALTADISATGFDYEIDADALLFRLIRCEGYETIYLELELQEVASGTSIYSYLDTAIEMLTLNEQAKATGVGQMDQKTVQEYETFVLEVKAKERKMLKKFILLLNSKKQRICELEEKLKAKKRHQTDEDTDMEQDTEPENNDDEATFSGATQAMTPPPPTATSSRSTRSRRIQSDSDDE